jgi:hypothetical protein
MEKHLPVPSWPRRRSEAATAWPRFMTHHETFRAPSKAHRIGTFDIRSRLRTGLQARCKEKDSDASLLLMLTHTCFKIWIPTTASRFIFVRPEVLRVKI